MAIKPYEIITPKMLPHQDDYQDIVVVLWEGLSVGDEGAPYEKARFADRSVQVRGDFSAAAVQVKGTNFDDTDYFTLTDPQGNDINLTLPKGEQITEITRLVKPVVVGGGPGTSVDVVIIFRKG